MLACERINHFLILYHLYRHQGEHLDCKRGRANKTGLFGAGATNDEAKYNTTCIKFLLRKKVIFNFLHTFLFRPPMADSKSFLYK